MILVDSSSQAWDIEVDIHGVLFPKAIAGGGATSILINDSILAVTYALTIGTNAELIRTQVTHTSQPTSITVLNPASLPYSIQIANGVLGTASASTPSITTLSVSTGIIGTSVTITGTSFGTIQGLSTISFHGISANPTNWSMTSIIVNVPVGATTGNIVVNVDLQNSNGVNFTVILAPNITSVTPSSGAVGATITTIGTNFGALQGSSKIQFNGISAGVLSWSDTTISATVPIGAVTGNVIVIVSGINSNSINFIVLPAPNITSLIPNSSSIGLPIEIHGANFGATQGSNTVKFNGILGAPSNWSASLINVIVPLGATTGNVVVFASGVNSNGVNLTIASAPSITSLSSPYGIIGASITINGLNFGSSQGSSTVTFNGITASPTSWNTNSIIVLVPVGATTGNIIVTVAGIDSNGVNFAVIPNILSLSPLSGTVGTSVTITGTNFGSLRGLSTVTFNGITASISSWSDGIIVATVPVGANTGNVVVTVSGFASNGSSFFVISIPPVIISLSATSGNVGIPITITGSNFGSVQGLSKVVFNGILVTSILSWAASSILVLVPIDATTGDVVVTVAGIDSNGITYSVIPTLVSLMPNSGAVGALVTVLGTGLGSAQSNSTITFNGISAAVSSWGSTAIHVSVPNGATTGNVIVTVSGTATNGLSFTMLSAPIITGLTPISGAAGTPVVIIGTNFGATKGTSTVLFNGIMADTVTWSDTSITTIAPVYATTGNVVVFADGVNSNGKNFTIISSPIITGITPNAGAIGVLVSITGLNFGVTQRNSIVLFNGVSVNPISWNDNVVLVVLPPGISTGGVTITVGNTTSNVILFTVVQALAILSPTIISLSITAGTIGSFVTITGANFGISQGSSVVTFNQTLATSIESWGDTSISVIVPNGATTGYVIVTAAATNSNGVYFTISIPTLQQAEYISTATRFVPTALNKWSYITQSLQNYFDETDSRSRANPNSLEAQILNMIAVEMEDLNLRASREISLTLQTVPTNIDNGGVYWSSTLPNQLQTVSSVTALKGTTQYILQAYDDTLPVPSRVEIDPTRTIPISNVILFSVMGIGDDLSQTYGTQHIYPGTLPIPDKLTVWVDQIGKNQVSIVLTITGQEDPQPAWISDAKSTTEVLVITEEGLATTNTRWTSIDNIVVHNLPVGARLRGWGVPFNLPAVPDAARPYSTPEDRDILYSRYWAVDNVNGFLNEAFEATPLTGLEVVHSYKLPEIIADVAIEPFTDGMYVASSTKLYYIDRREYTADLSNTGLPVEPIYGIRVVRAVTNNNAVVSVEISAIPNANAASIKQYRYIVNANEVVSSILPSGALGSKDTGWTAGAPKTVSFSLIAQGQYQFTLQCQDVNGVITSDIYPFLNPNLPSLAILDMSALVDTIKGIAFDSYGQLWLWNGSFAFTVIIHNDGYVIDSNNDKLFVTESYDSLQVA